MNDEAEDTLPDDAWKDSFDKLLDQRPILREMNLIKRNIRASFNMNSSYENSDYENSGITSLNFKQTSHQNGNELTMSMPARVQYLDVPKNTVNKQRLPTDTVSTPIKNNTASNPFKCTLSPIGPWELKHFKGKDRNECKKNHSKDVFNATPMSDAIVNVECVESLNNSNVENKTNRWCSIDISPLVLVRKKWKSKNQKQVCFVNNENDEKIKQNSQHDKNINISSLLDSELNLPPGKWRKSLNCLRRIHPDLEKVVNRKSLMKEYCKGRSTGAGDRPKSLAIISIGGNRKSVCIRTNSNQTRSRSRSTYSLGCNNFKRQVLQRCGQRRILTFGILYSEEYLKNCCKIGEGAFGEVFLHTDESSEKTVLKIIPIEGKELVNGEVQKTFEQILPEIIISMELSNLNDDKRQTNITSGFVNLQRVKCVKGQYPSHLQKLWEEYDLKKESENDHPNCFTCNQQYIVLELGYSGQDLESYQFKNAEQSFSALQQIILTLAVAENEFQFEHRDLHWGNVLVLDTNHPYKMYKLGNTSMTIPTKGVQITIIDYTLSRMTLNDYCFYNDLSNDEELFSATGDYQFEIYRMMRKILNNNWEKYEPKTNIFWISYILSKLIDGVFYKNARSKNHLQYLDRMKKFQKSILSYNSCEECTRNLNLY